MPFKNIKSNEILFIIAMINIVGPNYNHDMIVIMTIIIIIINKSKE